MNFPGKRGFLSLDIVEGIPQVRNTFSKFLCHCEGVSLGAREGFIQFRKHTQKSKNLFLTYTIWQLNEVQLQILKWSRGKSFEVSGNKKFFQDYEPETSEIGDKQFSQFYRRLPTNIYLQFELHHGG